MKKSLNQKIAERFAQRQRAEIDRKEQRELERNKDYQPLREGHLPSIT